MHAKDLVELKKVRAVIWAAAIGLKDVTTGVPYCFIQTILSLLKRMEFQNPFIYSGGSTFRSRPRKKLG